MKKTLLFLLLALFFPAAAYAQGHHGNHQDNRRDSNQGHHQHGSHGTGSGGSNSGSGNGGQPPVVTPPPTPPPPPSPVPPPPVTGGIVLPNVYITGYADGDNTPPGSPVTDLDGHHGVAGGNCTYANPTTMAVGHVISGGVDKGDFAYGTIFYVADMQGGGCYFVAQDTCGDGSAPQNGPCHKPEEGSLQLDAYVGPKGSESCEGSMTTIHTVIENPPPGLSAVAHNICNN